MWLPNLPREYRTAYTHADEQDQYPSPKLESLMLSDLNIFFGREDQLLDLLQERHDRNLALKKVGVRSCRVHEFESELRELVEEVEWENVIVEDLGSDEDSDAESYDGRLGTTVRITTHTFEVPFNPDDKDACEKYHSYLAE